MQTAELGRQRTENDGCRRYRPVQYTFDTRKRFLEVEIQEDWDPAIQKQWRENQERARDHLLAELGPMHGDRKIDDFMAIEAAPWSVVAHHNLFLHQARHSFAVGAYYPCLTASGALGERILNQLILTMRDDFPKSKKVTTPESFQDWDRAVEILHDDWEVLTPDIADAFVQLKRLRNKAVHYSPTLDGNDARAEALAAIILLQEIIGALFSPIGPSPHLLSTVPGEFYVAIAHEDDPMVKHFIIPASALVSPHHLWAEPPASPVIQDDANYHMTHPNLSDAEFVEHRMDNTQWPRVDEAATEPQP